MKTAARKGFAVIPVLLALSACGGPEPEARGFLGSGDAADAVARCEYRNAFNGQPECKEYTGANWTKQSASEDCEFNIVGGKGELVEEGGCVIEPALGRCDVSSDEGLDHVIWLGGEDPGLCTGADLACTTFAKGLYEPMGVCLEPIEEDDHVVFIWPYMTCEAPFEEDAGVDADGEVCVWESINGCVEEGMDFRDYGSCDVVYTNRPYYSVEGYEPGTPDDVRLDDEAYLEELGWVASQVTACACVCCHTEDSPEGPAIWSIDGPTLWTDMLSNEALGMFAGHIDSSALGAYPVHENNGFDRITSGMPTTDPARMLAFWQAEFEARGLEPGDMVDYPPVGGPLDEQIKYDLPDCIEGDGVSLDGTVTWSDERSARYAYVLAEGSDNPGVPPNFDLPAGTVWRIDVAHLDSGFASGFSYGETPGDSFQVYPVDGDAPAPLVSGARYHLYVLYDVAMPIARCVFVAP